MRGMLADMGPFVAVTSPHTGRSPNDKFVVEGSRDRAGRVVGQGEPAHLARAFRCAARRRSEVSRRQQRSVRAGSVGRRGSGASALRALREPECVAHAVRAEHVPPPHARAIWRASLPNFTVLHAPEMQADPDAPRHAQQHLHRVELRQAHDPHRRHALRRASSRSRSSPS